MDFDLSLEDSESLEPIRLWADKVLPPLALAAQDDPTHLPPLLASFRDLGLTTMALPEELGGSGVKPSLLCVILQTIARIDASSALLLALPNALAFHAFSLLQNPLPSDFSKRLQGSPPLCFATDTLDLPALVCEATPSGWRLSGSASSVLGPKATGDLLLLASSPDHESFLFALPLGHGENERHSLEPSLLWTEKTAPLGLRSCPTFRLDLLRPWSLPPDACLGRLSADAPQRLTSAFHTALASISLGVGQAALRSALAYAKDRTQFGQPIAHFQAIQWKIADSSIKLDAAEVVAKKAAWAWQEGESDILETTAFQARLLASDAALFSAQEAIQIHGGYGFIREFPVERFYRDAAALRSRFSPPHFD